ncbi:MAG TPA: glycosyltransferase N-terminal domain-containing protein [Candidatus Dormibacteraeota bacterium]|nr:glycosyltransferase N-terminal domain-containing protein [Candidatus Dormibacteraeota bacterium]
MIRIIYNLLWPLGLLFFLPGYLLKMLRRGGYREKFGQRLGIYGAEIRPRLAKQRSTWLHAVSVGEVTVALKLAHALRALQPNLHCVLTTTTTTGFALANKSASPWVEVMYTPLDFWPIIRGAFAIIHPARILLIEAEVWPNLVAEAHARRIPIALVNARLSPRSENRFRLFRLLVAPTFRLLDLVCVQEPEDVDRWRGLGVEPNRIRHTGSIKYDPVSLAERIDTGGIDVSDLDAFAERPVLFGGSTHRGEEEILAKAFLKLRQKFPLLCLFIAPRHVERLREIRAQLGALSLHVRLASKLATLGHAKPECVLLDTTGQLRNWYPIATVVFIGKSLMAHGGQNPVEPIIGGKPVIFGPHMENFATLAMSLVANNGAIEVNDAGDLERAAEKLLRDGETRRLLVQNARKVLAQHRGATARTAQLIVDLG